MLVVMFVVLAAQGLARKLPWAQVKGGGEEGEGGGQTFAQNIQGFLEDWGWEVGGEGHQGGGQDTEDGGVKVEDLGEDYLKGRSDQVDRGDVGREELEKEGTILPLHHHRGREELEEEGTILAVHPHATLEEVYRSHYNHRVEEGRREEEEEDPFILQGRDLKFHELLAADIYFNFLTRTVLYFVGLSLCLPAVLPLLSLLTGILGWLLGL